jgi:hypothetical protein
VRPSPGLVLALLLALIATQVTRLVIPERGPYLWTLGISCLGVVLGELVAGSGHLAGVSLGVLHPVLDLAVVAVLQAVGALLVHAPARGDEQGP